MEDFPKIISIDYELDHFIMEGSVDLTLWGGDKGSIEMKPVRLSLDTDITNTKVLSCYVNDNGFGVQSIDHAYVSITAVYKSGCDHVYRCIEDFDFEVIGRGCKI